MEAFRVLHVFNRFEQGGIENFVMNVYRNIDINKIQFDFAFIDKEQGCFDDEVKKLGGKIYYFETEKRSFGNYKRSLKKIIKNKESYIAIHSHIYFFSGYVLKIAKKCGVKIRISHSHETQKGRKQTIVRRIYERIMRVLIKKNATHMLGCSDAACRALFGENAKYTVIYNGIDMSRFYYDENMRQEYRRNLGVGNRPVLLNVGRFADQKNHKFIVEVFEEVLKRNDDICLVLIGTGPLREVIENDLKQRGIMEKTIFLSNIMNVEAYYNAADVFILPSKYEGMGIVSIESQATGLYTLMSSKITKEVARTDIIEYLDIVEPKIWADKIMNIIQQKIERGKYNNIFVNSSFDIRKTIEDLEKVYLSNI